MDVGGRGLENDLRHQSDRVEVKGGQDKILKDGKRQETK